jgi:hypothetical protein
MQGIELQPGQVQIWHANPELDCSAFARAFGAPVYLSPRPAPSLPDERSKLLPADVRAARRAAMRRRNIQLGIAAVALLYLGLAGWAGFELWQGKSEAKRLKEAAQLAAPEELAYQDFVNKWSELSKVIDPNQQPLELLYAVHRAIPPKSGLRLREAEISASEIKLKGEAQQASAVSHYDRNLKQSNDLRFEWSMPEPTQNARGWEFYFTGSLPQP